MNRTHFARYVTLMAGCASLAAPAFAVQRGSNWLREQFLTPYEVASVSPDTVELIRHDIKNFGSCQFFAKRGVRWSQDFDDGSRLELRCEPIEGELLPGFHLWYRQKGHSKFEIGRCVFDDGFNQGWYYTSSDPSVRGPVRVEWLNIDGGKNDGGGRKLDVSHVTRPEEPYADIVRWTFDVKEAKLECVSDKYNYADASDTLPVKAQPLAPYLGEPVLELRQRFVEYATK